ncbi:MULTISPECIES: hypothetical protein [Priestia]|jgi:hypothetical protein|uniref:Uncharacterized protein n=5 Tax=Priestia TaxID=2800373 RepID=D5E060_PRIM1|nr:MULTISPECIES: hypothetical protein [Priestia]AVX07388.1 hypothetical protein CS527_06525 [Bacillus sp. Y-01]KOP73579.1 hypothetical protein AMS61_04225 [Bacillus sp. FJAT-21351]KQU26699.1 hypothetical protein ASG61_01750 [Bacillus sp. Leaf75]KRD84382.1 hypothetical protein ASE51_16865 [Bacillus sp. Root147]KRE10630.1 hypothetical protein ASE46_03410 [Bacillus sp. Root239]KRF53207.1 hypothetical protein ASG98_22190 [Bacillus sp. Soil531]MBK0007335.1 hypothetical protein [Bacillus sp. S35]
MGEHQQLVRVRELANEIIRLRLQDRTTYDELELQNNVELLSRSVVDLVNIMLAEDVDSSTSLKATASKMKMVYNNMHQAEKKDYLHF